MIKIYRSSGTGSHKSGIYFGSNDGSFISNFDSNNSVCVEPCENFSQKTSYMGYHSYSSFWNKNAQICFFCRVIRKTKRNSESW